MTVKVPPTLPFSLSNIMHAVRYHESYTANNFQSCIDNAFSDFFDPNYDNDSYAPVNSMLRFQNYGQPLCYIYVGTPDEDKFLGGDLMRGMYVKSRGYDFFLITYTGLLNHYKMTTAWDITTAYLYESQQFYINDTFGGLYFSFNGLYLYFIKNGNRIEQFQMSIAWDITTATLYNYYDLSPIDDQCHSLFIGDYGNKMYVNGNNFPGDGQIYEFNLSSAWNLSGMSLNHQIRIGANDPYLDINFSNDGKKIFISRTGAGIIQANLKNSWDLSSVFLNNVTTSFGSVFFTDPPLDPPLFSHFFIREIENGFEFFVNENSGKKIYKYTGTDEYEYIE